MTGLIGVSLADGDPGLCLSQDYNSCLRIKNSLSRFITTMLLRERERKKKRGIFLTTTMHSLLVL